MAKLTFAESFVRGYAELVVKRIEVTIDKEEGVTRLAFYGREQTVNMRDLVLQEDAFRRLGNAVHVLLGIPEQIEPPDADDLDVTQLTPESAT